MLASFELGLKLRLLFFRTNGPNVSVAATLMLLTRFPIMHRASTMFGQRVSTVNYYDIGYDRSYINCHGACNSA